MSNQSNHSIDDEMLSAYLDDELSDAERAAVTARLAADPEARQTLEQLREASSAIKSLPSIAPDPEVRERVLQRLAAIPTQQERDSHPMEERSAGDATNGFRRGLVWASLAVAASVVFVVLRPGELVDDRFVGRRERGADDRPPEITSQGDGSGVKAPVAEATSSTALDSFSIRPQPSAASEAAGASAELPESRLQTPPPRPSGEYANEKMGNASDLTIELEENTIGDRESRSRILQPMRAAAALPNSQSPPAAREQQVDAASLAKPLQTPVAARYVIEVDRQAWDQRVVSQWLAQQSAPDTVRQTLALAKRRTFRFAATPSLVDQLVQRFAETQGWKVVRLAGQGDPSGQDARSAVEETVSDLGVSAERLTQTSAKQGSAKRGNGVLEPDKFGQPAPICYFEFEVELIDSHRSSGVGSSDKLPAEDQAQQE